LLRRSLLISSADGSQDRVEPILWNNLARPLLELGRLSEAITLAERAHAGAVRERDEVVTNQALLLRGRLHLANGNLARAAQIFDGLEPRSRRMYPAHHTEIVALTIERAALAQARGEMDTASTLADRAVAMAESNPHLGYLLFRSLVRRSGLALQLKRFEAAASDAARAVTLELERTDPDARSCYAGHAYLALGRALAGQGRADDARSAFASAQQHLEPTLGEDHPDTRAAREGAAGQ
jgi:tetratricopeptide (TPR) repeat protein